ncbi:MAG: endopeptidase La [Anaerolineae bacterium]|nr:endopeptidase La [Anaerolineae bacterium]
MSDWLSDWLFDETFFSEGAKGRTAKKRGQTSGRRHTRKQKNVLELPVLPLRDMVVFPHMVAPLFVGRERSVRAVEEALTSGDGTLVVVTQKDSDVEWPGADDLYTVGTVVTVGRVLRMPDGNISVLTQGETRVQILEITQKDPFLKAEVVPVEEPVREGLAVEALMRAVLTLFDKVVQLSQQLPEDAYVAAMNVDEPGWLADLIASMVSLPLEERQNILETFDPEARLQRLSVLLGREVDVLELENRIHTRVQEEVDKSQREYFLREQMKAIQTELGEIDSGIREAEQLREKILASGMPEEVREKALQELDRLVSMPSMAPEVAVIRTYLDWLVELPWTEETEDSVDIAKAAEILESEHYGLEKAKERILEYIAVRQLAKEKMRSPILCFVGPPGTGKTSMGRSIAKALGRKFVRVSLGGIRDEAEIRGHRRTYVGAMPGRIIQTMRRAGTVNPLFMLDEIDKIGMDFRGDPAAALLEVLDPEQNYAFSDHYLDVPYDLSKVMFITTANVLHTIPPALQDRMEVIEFPGYIEEEKVAIAKRFLIPRQLEQHGLAPGDLTFSDSALQSIIREYTYEAGVRNLERSIAQICRKTARRVAEGKRVRRRITPALLASYLGPPRYTELLADMEDEVGAAMGVAWTEAGGDIMPVEVSLMEGKGGLTLTGQMGDIMQESAQAALSYARAHAKELGIDVDFDKVDIHIHVPEGAIPKDGPSAGVTMAVALISALSQRPVRHEVGMTGEITLRGRILPIGGVREKVMAAHRAGLKALILPRKNEKDLVEIPRRIRREMQFILVDRMEEVLPAALEDAATPPPKPRKRAKKKAQEAGVEGSSD